MKMRFTIPIIAFAVAVSGSLAWAQAPAQPAPAAAAPAVPATKIGFVDLQRVIIRSAAGVAARDQLERERGNMQKEMDGKRQEIEKLREELEKKGPLMTADARRDKQDVFERKRRDFTRMVDDYQKELDKKEQLLLQKVYQELAGVIEKVGKQRGYYLVVERTRGAVLYAAAEADLTDEIIRAYDQENGANKGKK